MHPSPTGGPVPSSRQVLFTIMVSFLLLFTAYDAQAQWPRGKGKRYVQLSLGRADAS